MPGIRQEGIDAAVHGLDDPVPFTADYGDTRDSLLLIAGGFEERARRFVDYAVASRWHSVIVVRYPWNREENEVTEEACRRIDTASGVKAIEYTRALLHDDLRQSIVDSVKAGAKRLVVDVSGMSSVVIHACLGAAFEVAADGGHFGAAVYYAESGVLHPTAQEWQTLSDRIRGRDVREVRAEVDTARLLSAGSSEVFSSPLYTGSSEEGAVARLAIFPGFEYGRAAEMIAFSESRYGAQRGDHFWVLPRAERAEESWRVDALRGLYEAFEPNQVEVIDANSVRQTILHLSVLREHAGVDRQFVIGALGSKMHHVAIGLFLRSAPGVELLHCEPSQFIPGAYSHDVGREWWLDLGDLTDRERRLASVGMLQFVW